MKVADMHCDTILAILRGKEQGKEISLRKNNLNVDLERMKNGGLSDSEFCPFSGSGGSDTCRKSIPLCNENGGCILSGNGEK